MEPPEYNDVDKKDIIQALEQLEDMIGDEEDQKIMLENNFNHMYMQGFNTDLITDLPQSPEVTSNLQTLDLTSNRKPHRWSTRIRKMISLAQHRKCSSLSRRERNFSNTINFLSSLTMFQDFQVQSRITRSLSRVQEVGRVNMSMERTTFLE